MDIIKKIFYFTIILTFFAYQSEFDQIKLPKLISDGMILQRNENIKIWGWASPEESIQIEFLDSTYQTITDSSGEWYVNLSKQSAGGPYEMLFKGKNEITISNILIGDVWVCSGQSNMETTMERVSPLYPREIADSKNSEIRQFYIPRTFNFKAPQKDIEKGEWIYADPSTIYNFTAVGYFFANELNSKYKVPIGIINSALGGSPAESWLSEEALKKFPEHYSEAVIFRDDYLIEKIKTSDQNRINAWYDELYSKDKGFADKDNIWYENNFDNSEWDKMNIPGFWKDTELGAINGVVWFRKDFIVPELMVGNEFKLYVGRIVDADSTYINGEFVGNVTYQYPPRRYDVPSQLLKKGKNTIVVRVVNVEGNGGFITDKEYMLFNDKDTINLEGEWTYKLGAEMPKLKGQTFIRWKPAGLFNAMIAPLLNYKIKGVLWYQGESNAGRPNEYYNLFQEVINDWRDKWGIGDFPFLYVQLPNFMESKCKPSESNWALLREAQLKALCVPNTAMAVAIDIGEWNDIHPLNKKDVGKRLSLAAQNFVYEEDVIYSGPLFHSQKIVDDKIILSFKSVGSGLMIKGGKELKEFAIAESDKKFIWANAQIKNNKVIVWNDKIKNPKYVRYAWADNPSRANLYNKEGLPASPFRTDR